MLFEAELSKQYWAEVVATAVYLLNRSPNSSIKYETPEELWTGEKHNLSHLRIFGCKAVAHIPNELRQKFDSKGEELMFVDYCEDSKGYRLIDPQTKKIAKSRDVVFLKDFREGETKTPAFIKLQFNEERECDVERNNTPTDKTAYDTDDEENNFVDSIDIEQTEPKLSTEKQPNLPRKSTRIRKPVNREDYCTYLIKNEVTKDPETIEEALALPKSKQWIKAMEEECESLITNKTWTFVDLPERQKTLDTKWIFKKKVDSSGKMLRYKARLVARGCKQIEGIDFHETYFPVVRYSSIRFLCALAAKLDLDVSQMDVTAAYLHGDIDEDIYLQPPEELIEHHNKRKVWKLNKAIYGLKQSGRAWNEHLNKTLIKLNFSRSQTDTCIYVKKNKADLLIITVYVDDLLILSNNEESLLILKKELSRTFKMKDLWEATYLLGLATTRDRKARKIWLDQSSYTNRIIQEYGMEDCNQYQHRLIQVSNLAAI